MSSEAAAQVSFDETLLAQLACPACHNSLRSQPGNLVCSNCERSYPVIDGIPVLIADRAALPGTQR